jgi:hemolysin III
MRIREPINGLSHLLGLVLAAAGTLMLMSLASRPEQLAGFGVYGSTLILLYAASTLYHTLPLPERPLRARSRSSPWITGWAGRFSRLSG